MHACAAHLGLTNPPPNPPPKPPQVLPAANAPSPSPAAAAAAVATHSPAVPASAENPQAQLPSLKLPVAGSTAAQQLGDGGPVHSLLHAETIDGNSPSVKHRALTWEAAASQATTSAVAAAAAVPPAPINHHTAGAAAAATSDSSPALGLLSAASFSAEGITGAGHDVTGPGGWRPAEDSSTASTSGANPASHPQSLLTNGKTAGRKPPVIPKLQLPGADDGSNVASKGVGGVAAGAVNSASPLVQRILSMRERFAEAEVLLTPRTRPIGDSGFRA